jgi:hypothetical protein
VVVSSLTSSDLDRWVRRSEGRYCRLKSAPAQLLVAFILISSSSVGTLQLVVTTITWKWGVASYLVVTALAVAMIGALAMVDTPVRIPARLAGGLSAAFLLALALLYSSWYDLEPTWDRGDALAVGVNQLMSGRSPYTAQTNLGNPVSPMLGGILLAAPFVVIGGSVYWMGMTWLSAATLFTTLHSGAQAGLAFLALMIASPLVRIELVNQSDLVVNALALLLFGSLNLWLARRVRVNAIWRSLFVAGAAVFAFAVAYRIPFGLVTIPLAAYLWRLAGSTLTILWVAVFATALAGLTVIPWIMDPQVGLTPIAQQLHKVRESGGDQDWLLTVGLALSVLLLVTWLSVRIKSEAGVWGVAALGTAAGIAAVAAAHALSNGAIDSDVVGAAFGYSGIWLVLGLASVTIRDVEKPHAWQNEVQI